MTGAPLISAPWVAALVALVAWWASTGAILALVRRAERAGGGSWAVIGTLPVLAFGVAALAVSLGRTDAGGAYLGFAAALAIWGWIELAFLTGMVTGPMRRPARAGVPEWERFVRAWGTIAYHEMLLAAALIAIALASHGAANGVALATFGLLWAARVSAKLNLYLGVRKVNVEFIPRALAHLPSHFREARVNWLFPTSVTALTFAAFHWAQAAMAAPEGAGTGHALLAALAALALLEHWFMVMRLPDEKLWRWMLPDAHDTTTMEEGRDAVR
jgi:putative photosynthetic complex assembly protein 2